MELSFLLQDGHVNKLRFCSEVLCQKKKKKELHIKQDQNS